MNLGPFDGGLNLRDSYTEIAPSELADGTNFTLDERGVATKRNDCPATADFPTPPGAVITFYYSQTIGRAIIQVGSTLYQCTIGAGSWTSFRTLGSSLRVAFCDFGTKMVYIHAADGVRTYDGTTDAAVAGSPSGGAIAVWQNKVWAGGVSGGRLFWSKAGDVTTWATSTDFVDLRDKDTQEITALYPGGGGLLVFKDWSTYRVNDSTTGAYTTIDYSVGTVSSRSVASQDGRIYTWAFDGLYEGDGLTRFRNIGDKLRPRFVGGMVNGTTKFLVNATTANGRVYFAFPRTSSSICDAILEYNPRVGWMMEHYFAGAEVGGFAVYLNTGVRLVAFASGSATIKGLFTGTTRTGFTCALKTGYIEPFQGKLARLRQLRAEVDPGASGSLAVGVNYQDGGGSAQTFSVSQAFAAAGQQRPLIWPGLAGRAFQASLDDSAGALNALSVYGVGLDFLPLEA